MTDPMKPNAAVLCKLGSIAVHVQELLGPHGRPFDTAAILSLLSDPEVGAWLKAMDERALLPVKR